MENEEKELFDPTLALGSLLFGFECSTLLNGGVAQLGEHLLCKQGVIGSIPFISTNAGS